MTQAWARALLFGSTSLAAACGSVSLQPRAPSPPFVPAPVVVAGTLDGRMLLEEVAARARDTGAGPLTVVATGEAAERERLGAFVEIPEGQCLLGYARASSTVEDLDLAAFSDEGTPVAVDDAPDPRPTLLLCPPHPNRVYLAAVAASGEGLVAVGAQLVPALRGAAVGRVMNAHGTRTASSRAADAWPGLDDHIRRHRDVLHGAWESFRKVAIAVDARVPASVALPLEADGCTDVLVVPDEDVGGLEVEALDERGRFVGRATAGDRVRTLTVCSPTAWTGTLSVRPHVGQGLAAVVLSRARSDVAAGFAGDADIAWAAASEPLARARARRDKALRDAGYGVAAGALEGALAVGALRSASVALAYPASQAPCWRLDVVGGAPTALVAASVWDESDRLLARAEGSSSATVFACVGKKLRVDTEARARPGPYTVMWRSEPWSDASFVAHPVAASRMLTRMAAGSASLLEGTASVARGFHVDAGHEVSWESALPAGTCVRVVAAAEGDGAGLVGRIVDGTSGDELDRAHAMDAIALRACAPEGAVRSVTVSVAAGAGKLDVVVGQRVMR